MDVAAEAQRFRTMIKKLEHDKAHYAGQLDALMAQLQAEFGLSSIEEARTKMQEIRAQQEQMEKQISARMARLQTLLG